MGTPTQELYREGDLYLRRTDSAEYPYQSEVQLCRDGDNWPGSGKPKPIARVQAERAHKGFGGKREPQVNWSAIGARPTIEARMYAKAIELAADAADELADLTGKPIDPSLFEGDGS